MSSSLKELGQQIQENIAVAAQDPGTDTNQRRMRLGNIMQANENLRSLRQAYRQELLSRAVFTIVTGSQAEKFAKLAEEEFSCFAVNAEDFYKEVTSAVPEVLFQNKASSGNLFEHIAAGIEEKARLLEIISLPALVFESKYSIVMKNSDDMLSLAKTAINDKIGGEIVGLDAILKVTDRVISSDLSGKIVPIILYTEDSSIVESLSKGFKRSLSRNTFIISTGSKVDQKLKEISFDVVKSISTESVEKSLVKLKQSLV